MSKNTPLSYFGNHFWRNYRNAHCTKNNHNFISDCPPNTAQFGSTCYWLETTAKVEAEMLEGCQRVHPDAIQAEIYTEDIQHFLTTLTR